MTQVYSFKFGFTKLGQAFNPSPLPIFNMDDGTTLIISSGTLQTTPIAGEFRYYYTGTNGLDLVGLVHTSDVTVDQQDLFGMPFPFLAINNVVVPIPVGSSLSAIASNFSAYRGDSLLQPINGLGSLTNLGKLYFTVKVNPDDVDASAIIKIELAAGLQVLNKQPASVSGDGTITINDVNLGNITITLIAADMALLNSGQYYYDIEIVRTAGTPVSTLTSGIMTIVGDVTRATI